MRVIVNNSVRLIVNTSNIGTFHTKYAYKYAEGLDGPLFATGKRRRVGRVKGNLLLGRV
jgi:hypothetical protein